MTARAAIVIIALCTALAAAPAGEGPFENGGFNLLLRGGVTVERVDGPGRTRREAVDLFVLAECRQGRWEPEGWAYSPAWWPDTLRRLTVDGRCDAGSVRATVEARFADGGPAGTVRADLLWRNARWEGDFQTVGVGGSASGPVVAAWVALPPAAAPLPRPGHPRLVFGAEDLPRLRTLARSAEGRVVIDRLRVLLEKPPQWKKDAADAASHAAGYGLLHLLALDRSDPTHAEQAQRLIERRLRVPVGGWPLRDEAAEVVATALAYDCCYDVWDAAFRRQVADHLLAKARSMVEGKARNASHAPESAWNATVRGAALVAALAVAGDPGPYPQRPSGGEILDVEPGSPPGLPAWSLVSDRVPEAWLVAGPFHEAAGADPVLAGEPAAGGAVEMAGRRLPLRPLPAEALWRGCDENTQHPWVLDVLAGIDRSFLASGVYLTAIRSDREQVVRFRLDGSFAASGRARLSGRPIVDGDLVRLRPGLHPLILTVEVGETDPWGRLWLVPRFQTLTDDEVRRSQAETARRLADWQRGRDRWLASGQAMPGADETAAAAARHLRLFLTWGLGDGGAASEGDFLVPEACARSLLPALHAWRRVMGAPMPGESSAAALVPNLLLRSQATPDGPVLAGYGLRSGPLRHLEVATLGAGLIDPDLRSACRALVAGLADPDAPAGLRRPHHALYALAAPAEAAARPAPTCLLDRRKGLAVFRSGDGPEAVVLTAYLKSQPLAGASSFPDAGSLRLLGLGRAWGVRGAGDATRGAENVLLLDEVPAWGGAILVDHATTPVGGRLSLDLAGVYCEREGSRPQTRSVRSLAVDFSRACGAEALVAIHDAGEPGRPWTWRWNAGAAPRIDGRRFLVDGGDGRVLCGTVVAPAQATLSVQEQAVTVAGGSDYLVILTLGRGAPPPVAVDAARPLACRAGGVAVAVQGGRVVIGD